MNKALNVAIIVACIALIAAIEIYIKTETPAWIRIVLAMGGFVAGYTIYDLLHAKKQDPPPAPGPDLPV